MKLGGKKKGATLPGGMPAELADELDDFNMNGHGKDELDAWGVGDGDLIDVNADEDDWSAFSDFICFFFQVLRGMLTGKRSSRCLRKCTNCEGCSECRRPRVWGYCRRC